jgi:hypothetical protein
VRRLISALGAGLTAAALAILFGFAGTAHAQEGCGSGSGPACTTIATTATTAFGGGTAGTGLANTGADTWILATGAGLATAGAVGVRRLLRNRTA